MSCAVKMLMCLSVCVFQMCERCNRRTECTKRLSIQRFPQVIVIRILGNNSLMCLYIVAKSNSCVVAGYYALTILIRSESFHNITVVYQ